MLHRTVTGAVRRRGTVPLRTLVGARTQAAVDSHVVCVARLLRLAVRQVLLRRQVYSPRLSPPGTHRIMEDKRVILTSSILHLFHIDVFGKQMNYFQKKRGLIRTFMIFEYLCSF